MKTKTDSHPIQPSDPCSAGKVAHAKYALSELPRFSSRRCAARIVARLGELRQRAVADVQQLSRDVAGRASREEQRHPGDLGGNRRRRAGQTFVARLRATPGGDGVDGDTAG